MFVRAAVERALASGAPIVHDLHEAVGGTRRARQEIARDLDEAFRSGRLVAYRRDPPRASSAGAAVSRPEPEPAPEQWPAEEPESYVTIELVGEDGAGIPDARYRLLLPDQSIREGTLDGSGLATVRGKFSGSCKVSFPELDANAWEAA
jgi:hypothetical protein